MQGCGTENQGYCVGVEWRARRRCNRIQFARCGARVMRQKHDPTVNEQALAEQKKRAKREREAEKRRKKTRDKHRAQGLEHTKKYQRGSRAELY